MGDDVHHLVAKEDGGQGIFDNAILLCSRCHADYGKNPEQTEAIAAGAGGLV
jgi:5-methylcytosine-specific restriction endonuclease McrA